MNFIDVCCVHLFGVLFLSYTVANLADWGDPCNSTEDCSDHRYICKLDKFSVNRCLCDEFHKYFNISLGCIQMYNSTYIINKTVTPEVDRQEYLRALGDRVFALQQISGYFFLAVMMVVSIVVVVYCIYINKSDNDLEKSISTKFRIKTV